MGWIEFEALRFFCPDGADVFVGCESFEGLESSGEVVGMDEVGEMLPEVFVGLVVEAFDGGFLKGSVHALDLAIGPGVLGLGEAVVDVGFGAGELKGVGAEEFSPLERQLDLRSGGTPIAGRSEMHSVISEHGMDLVRHSLEKRIQEVGRNPLSGLLMHLHENELGSAVDGDQKIELALLRAHLRDIDMEVADRIGFELLAPGRSPSTSESLEISCRRRQRCSDDRVNSEIVACSAYRQSSSGSSVCRRKATTTASC